MEVMNNEIPSGPGTVKLAANSEKKKRLAPAPTSVRGKIQG